MNVVLVSPTLIGAHATATPTEAAALARPDGATGIILGAITADVTYTLDGTTPTATVGFTIKAGLPSEWVSLPVNATVKVYSASGTLNYQWYKA